MARIAEIMKEAARPYVGARNSPWNQPVVSRDFHQIVVELIDPGVMRASIVLVRHFGQGGPLNCHEACLGSGGSTTVSVIGRCRLRGGDGTIVELKFRSRRSILLTAPQN